MYDVALKRKWDNASVLESAKAEGKAEGKVEGKIEGKLEGKAEVVKNLLLDFGFTDEQAAQAAQVSLSFVQQVRADMAAKKK